MKKYVSLNLRLFDGEGAAAEGAPAEVQYGNEPETTVTVNTEDTRKADFEKLITGDYKDLYDQRVQKQISARFKETEALKAKAEHADKLSPVLEMLASKYGVDGKDPDAVIKAIEEDNSYYEDEAMEKGLSVEQLKYMKKMERENKELRQAQAEKKQKEQFDRDMANWVRQAEELKGIYPSLDLMEEFRNPESNARMLGLLRNGIDVKTAYEVIHKDDIIGGAMQYTAQQVAQKTVNDIKARGMRPSENGASGAGAAVVKKDPSSFTRKDREEIARRRLRGEHIPL